jgi:chloramphenicol-sensitive protein RarD
MSQSVTSSLKIGVLNALAAYTIWGFAPIYFKLLHHISAEEILMHRVVWSVLLLAIIIIFTRKMPQTIVLLKQPKALLNLAITAALLACNWYLFIWAVNHDHMLDASLGYYINPLFSVALGMIFLGEKLRKWQWIAVSLAILGVIIQFISLGSLPVISFILAGTFGLYGLLRKKQPVDSFIGLFIESLFMLPIALIFWWWLLDSPTSDLTLNSWSLNFTLIMAGVVTTAPLLCFTTAAKYLTLASLGFFQYIGPSLMFILAVLVYDESLEPAKLITFMFIWSALLIYSLDAQHFRQKNKQLAKVKA